MSQARKPRSAAAASGIRRPRPDLRDPDGVFRFLALDSAQTALRSRFHAGISAPLARCLRGIDAALRGESPSAAIRLVDRAWRIWRSEAPVLAPIYGRLLSLQQEDPEAALRILRRVEVPDADVAALIVRALLALRRPEEARAHLDQALLKYSVLPGGLLARAASAALYADGVGASGWVGLDPAMNLIGVIAAGTDTDTLLVESEEYPLTRPVLAKARHDGGSAFTLRCPAGDARGTLLFTAAGLPLLGGHRRLPVDFGLDGRSDSSGTRIHGWVRIGWQGTEPVRLLLEDEAGRAHRLRTRTACQPGYRWPFELTLRDTALRGARIAISAALPDGRWQALTDSPLLLPRAVRVGRGAVSRTLRWRKGSAQTRLAGRAAAQRAPVVDVVIPVYRGRQETLACIDSVLATQPRFARVIVVDDASDDTALAAALDRLAAAGRVTLLRNEQNQGFVRSVNRALALHTGHDVVLLNSDTLVFDDWLPRLRATAYSGARVGTVTPLSNDASIASYPRRAGAAMDAVEAAAMHKLAAWTHSGVSIEVPVGVGFCLYIRRDCLRRIGEFDAATFGMGYGEETDFCMRARRGGWTHRLAADVFVHHASGRSFGARREALLHRSQRLMNLRYPGYNRYVADFLALDALGPLRRRLDERRLMAFDGRFVLLVSLALEGGVERFIEERSRQIRRQGLVPLVLKPLRPGDRSRCELRTDALDVPNLRYEVPAALPELVALLQRLHIDSIEISHFLDLDPRVIDALRGLGLPYDVVLHDYSWICPRITLIDDSGRYCGEPAVAVCASCVRRNGSALGEKLSVPALRTRSGSWLSGARSVMAPSADAAARLSRYFPQVDIEVRAHKPLDLNWPQIAFRPKRTGIRVALLGAIGVHKGYDVLLACARDAVARRLPLEFVVVGYTRDDGPLVRTGRVFVTGRYAEREVRPLLRREAPDIVFLPSVWPETWCYTLDHALAAGLPVVAFDLGAIAERLRAVASGLLLPLGLSPREINDRIVAWVADNRIF